MTILAVGLGYCAERFVRTRGLFATTLGTTRDRARLDCLSRAGFRMAFWDGLECDAAVAAAVHGCEAMIVSAAPDIAGDPVLAAFRPALLAARRVTRVVYLSTIGVYGDYAGAWVDEAAALAPTNARSRARVQAEGDWLAFGQETGARVHILRLAGIYGPGRNALAAAARGDAKRIVKLGQVFNRIHVEDVARAIEAALASSAPGGVWNVADDEPSAPAAPIAYAAELLGLPPPPEIAFEDAQMSPMARSFWGESKRVSNARLKQILGVSLAYPTYREGLRALFESGEGSAEGQKS